MLGLWQRRHSAQCGVKANGWGITMNYVIKKGIIWDWVASIFKHPHYATMLDLKLAKTRKKPNIIDELYAGWYNKSSQETDRKGRVKQDEERDHLHH